MHNRRLAGRALAVLAVLLALSLSGIVLSSPGARADHDTVRWSVETTVTSTAGVYEDWPVILSDHQGSVYVFFISPSSGVQANVTVAKYHVSPLGNLLPVSRQIVNPTLGAVAQGFPISAAIDRSGYIYVAWTKSAGFTGGLNDEVMVTRSTDSGSTWAQTTTADPVNAYGDDYSPIVVAGPDGTISVVWLVNWGGLVNVAYSQSTNQAAVFSGFMNITDQGASYGAYWPTVAVDSHGRLQVVYEYYNPARSLYTLNYTWSDTGAVWAAPRPIVTNPAIAAFVPQMAVDSKDRVHLVWYSWIQTTGNTNSLQYRVSNDRGATWSPEIAVDQGLVSPQTFPGIAFTGDTVLVMSGYANGIDYAVSADGGMSFYPEETQAIANSLYKPRSTADVNGTIWTVYDWYNPGSSTTDIGVAAWHAPPTTPTLTSVSAGTQSLTQTWSASPEADVVEYRVYRSLDGTNYQIVATVPAPTTSFTDANLANGTYWYRVDAVDQTGLASHLSQPLSGTVGPTTQQLINQLESEIASLQAQLAAANASSAAEIASLQAQVAALQSALTSLQNSQAASNAATAAALAQLRTNLTQLQQKLNDLQTAQTEQATQTISYANLAFEVIVVVLLVVLLLNQMRKPKSPQMMMAQAGQVTAQKPGDEL